MLYQIVFVTDLNMLGLMRCLRKASTSTLRRVDVVNHYEAIRAPTVGPYVCSLARGYVQSSGSRSSSVRVGVIGAGRVAATVHMPNLVTNRRLDLSWIVEDNPAVAESVKSDLNITTPVHSSDQLPTLLDDKSIEAVFVFTPVPTHYTLIKGCLEKGKAVFTEKPTAKTKTQVEELYDTAEKVGRPLFAAYNRRFDPAYIDIHKMLIDGELGKLRMAKMTARDSPRPNYNLLRDMDNSGCNIISELAVHDFDFLTWIMRAEKPETVFAVGHAHDPVMADLGEPDVASVMVNYPSGAIGIIDLSWESCYGYDARIELFGSLGMARSESPRENFAIWDCETGSQRRRMMHSFPQRFRESFVAEIDHFIDCVEGKATPLVKKEECIMATLVMEAALESFRRKQAVNFQQFLTESGASIPTR